MTFKITYLYFSGHYLKYVRRQALTPHRTGYYLTFSYIYIERLNSTLSSKPQYYQNLLLSRLLYCDRFLITVLNKVFIFHTYGVVILSHYKNMCVCVCVVPFTQKKNVYENALEFGKVKIPPNSFLTDHKIGDSAPNG